MNTIIGVVTNRHQGTTLHKELFATVWGYPVYIIDGSALRKSVSAEDVLRGTDENFADFLDYGIYDTLRRHGGFRMVPSGEVWLAEELSLTESSIVMAVALERRRLLDAGKDSEDAYNASERLGSMLRRRLPESFRKPIKRRFISEHLGVRGYLVNGFAVRNVYSNRFIQGGHALVYDYIPAGEAWVDDTLDEDEYLPVFAHEAVEMALMRDKGCEYDEAHEVATRVEYQYR